MSIDNRNAVRDIAAHLGHSIEVAVYKDPAHGLLWDSTIECLDCGEVMIDGERLERDVTGMDEEIDRLLEEAQ